MKHRAITETALLAALLFAAGLFRLPSPAGVGEFQLSAPLAVGICAVFGFRIYLAAGLAASFLVLLTGTGTILHVITAVIFRLAAGGAWALFGMGRLYFLTAGPCGTLAARAVLAAVTGQPFWLLAAAALPGMLFTVCASAPAARLLLRCRRGFGKEKQMC